MKDQYMWVVECKNKQGEIEQYEFINKSICETFCDLLEYNGIRFYIAIKPAP